jgi:hypothetical protein
MDTPTDLGHGPEGRSLPPLQGRLIVRRRGKSPQQKREDDTRRRADKHREGRAAREVARRELSENELRGLMDRGAAAWRAYRERENGR